MAIDYIYICIYIYHSHSTIIIITIIYHDISTIIYGSMCIALIHLQAHAGLYDPPTSMEGWDPGTPGHPGPGGHDDVFRGWKTEVFKMGKSSKKPWENIGNPMSMEVFLAGNITFCFHGGLSIDTVKFTRGNSNVWSPD